MSPEDPRLVPVARRIEPPVPAGIPVARLATPAPAVGGQDAAARRSLRVAANILITVGGMASIGFFGALCSLPEGQVENLVFAIVLPIVAAPALLGGIGLRLGRGWGRAAGLVAFCLLLPAVPVGTAIGAVGLVLLRRGRAGRVGALPEGRS